jgi:hypothetical protein
VTDDERPRQVLALIATRGKQIRPLAETRCPKDGRLLGAAYHFSDGLWIWSAGHREPPRVARQEAAAFYLDAMDECSSVEEERALIDIASEILSSDVRSVARPDVMHVEVDQNGADRYAIKRPTSMVGGKDFLVTEVSCGCRRAFYLDLHTLIRQAAMALRGDQHGSKHVPALPFDLPERVVERLLESQP